MARLLIDIICTECRNETEDVWVDNGVFPPCVCCNGVQRRQWASRPPAVIGDEIDVTIRHALCHSDGTPRRFRSRQELARVAKRKGWSNHVEHKGLPGGDKSPHTSRWV